MFKVAATSVGSAMKEFALFLFLSAILLQFNGINGITNQTICSDTSRSDRPKRNHESDCVKSRKLIQSKTNAKDPLDRKPETFLDKSKPEQEMQKNSDIKKINRTVGDGANARKNNNLQSLPEVEMKINPSPSNKTLKTGATLTANSKISDVQKIDKESNTETTPKATVPKQQHHIVVVKPSVKVSDIKNKALENTLQQLEKDVTVAAKEFQTQDVIFKNCNKKTTSDIDLEDSKSNNIMEIKRHKYEEIRIHPNNYSPQVTRNLDGCDPSQANPYDNRYSYVKNNNYYDYVDDGYKKYFIVDFKQTPYVSNAESDIIKKTWLDTEIKIKTRPCYNKAIKNSYSWANDALSNKLYQDSDQY